MRNSFAAVSEELHELSVQMNLLHRVRFCSIVLWFSVIKFFLMLPSSRWILAATFAFQTALFSSIGWGAQRFAVCADPRQHLSEHI